MKDASGANAAPPVKESLDVRDPWVGSPDQITPSNLDQWYAGPSINLLPDKARLAGEGMDALVAGWRPAAPIIGRDTRVMGLGSCFASYFLAWLAENGFNRRLPTSPHNALVRYGSAFENAAVIAQQFRWAFEGLDAASIKWIGKDRQLFEATDERRRLVRETLEQTDVLVLTLGLSEVWYDRLTGEPLWRALTRKHYDPDRHVFRVESLADTRAWLEKIESLRGRHVPGMKIVFTVSPVRLKATFRPVSAVTANSASKAILRAALDEFLRGEGPAVNRDLFYFPSYEIVQDFFRDPYEDDNRHVRPAVAARVVRCFADNFCDPALLASAATLPAGDEEGGRIAQLEAEVRELRRVCAERLEVMEGLDKAARERLELIDRLDAECARLRALRAQ
jgi:hypothetical protein